MADKKIEVKTIKLDLTKGKDSIREQIKARKAKMTFFIDNEKEIAKAKSK